jgi:methylmalonyl-CoA mutase
LDKKTKIVGVTAFPSADKTPPDVDAADAKPFAKPSPKIAKPGPDSTCPALTPWRAAEAFEHGAVA